jgi:hypothetical protein
MVLVQRPCNSQNTSVAIGDPSIKENAVLYLNSVDQNQGLIVPVVASRNTIIGGPEKGMIVFDNGENKLFYYNGANWIEVSSSTGNSADEIGLEIQGTVLQLLQDGVVVDEINLVDGTPASSGGAGQLMMWDGVNWVYTSSVQPISGQVLTWNDQSKTWEPGNVDSGSATNLVANFPVQLNQGPTQTDLKIADAGIGSSLLADNAVTSSKVETGAITSAKVQDGAIGTLKLEDQAITSAKIATGAIDNRAIATNAIDSEKIINASIAGEDLSSNIQISTSGSLTISGSGALSVAGNANFNSALQVTGTAGFNVLAGTGNRMVIASPSGQLNSQSLPQSGNLSTTTAGLTLTGNIGAINGTGTTINIQNASTVQNGLLTASDWNTFNSKLNASLLTTSGDLLFHNGTTNTRLARGSNGQALMATSTGIQWNTLPASGDMFKSVYDANSDNVVDVAASVNFSSQSANLVFASPNGLAGTPVFRSLNASDVPSFDVSKLSSGILPLVRGGTGISGTPANGQIPVGTGTGFSLSTITQGTGISVVNGAGTITISSTAMSNPMSTAGDLIIGGNLGVPARLGVGANNQVLSITSGSPGWKTLGVLSTVDVVSGGSNGTITDLTIDDNDISATAAIAGTKVSPNFGNQAIITTGDISAASTTLNNQSYTWPSAQGGSGTVLTNNGSGGLNWSSAGSGGSGGTTVALQAGENIIAGNVVYISNLDGKAYVSSTALQDGIRANGIATENKLSGETIQLQVGGPYPTTGLTVNTTYYLGPAGTITTTASGVRIGYSITSSSLLIQILQDDRDAIGTIKPYLKSFSGVPANNISAFWRECNGAVLSDPESLLNGTTLPDLNTRFLRGSTTSGNTGGAESHSHTLANGRGDTGGTQDYDVVPSNTGTSNHLPPYYEVVYLIKIK